MQPKIISRNSFQVMGTLTRITPDNENVETFGAIWQQFEAHRHQILSRSIDQKYYGISFNTGEQGVRDYLAAMAVKDVTATPKDLVVRQIPAAQYAVFECHVHKIGETYQFIFGEWFPNSQYAFSELAPAFEQYPSEGDDESPVLIHIPIVDKS